MAKEDKITKSVAQSVEPTKFTFHPRYTGSDALIVSLGSGRKVNLLGKDTEREVTEITGCCGNEKEVTYKVPIKGATQADYKLIYEKEKRGRKKTVVPA